MANQNICNICGANYVSRNGRWVCPACGAYRPEELSNEEVTLIYHAAQKLRLCEFEDAENAYSDIIQKYPENAEGYWGRLLSRYGIKYEDDIGGKKVPTCYAASIESVLEDKDYKRAMALADADSRANYEEQAAYIERVRKVWIEKARKEKPYDIFISYKDTDNFERTRDSVAAQELYIHLTKQGYRVFFSRESLRDKTGEKYEPYIFNALATAKMMLVYGSDPDYITSTWLKNEWTRYSKRMDAGEKPANSLIVACDGFSPSLLPAALASNQCLDASKPSFYADLDATAKRVLSEEKGGLERKKKKRKRLAITGASVAAALLVLFLIALEPFIIPSRKYAQAVEAYESGNYALAKSTLTELSGYGMYMDNFLPKDNIVELFTRTNANLTCTVDGLVGVREDARATLDKIEVPVYFGNTLVTGIAEGGFANCPSLTQVSLPRTIQKISHEAFFGCSKLTKINLEENLMEIGSGAFAGCTSLSEISLPAGLASIRDRAFEGCTSLSAIKIPESLTVIGSYAFMNCKALCKIKLPSELSKIGDAAFSNCTSLAEVNIPDSVVSIGAGAFANTAITEVSIPRSAAMESGVFKDCISLREVTFMGSNLPSMSFLNCTALETLHLSDQLRALEGSAFQGCLSLQEVTLSENLKTIGNYAFKSCRNLQTVHYGGTVAQFQKTYNHSIGYVFVDTSDTLTVICSDGTWHP